MENNKILKPTSNEPRDNVPFDLFEEFVYNGEVDLVKNVDYRNFDKTKLHELYNKVDRYLNYKIDDSRPDYDVLCKNIDTCLNIIQKQICKNDYWELTNYNVYTHCYNGCVHKVLNKTTGIFCTLTGDEIHDMMQEEKIKSLHFNA